MICSVRVISVVCYVCINSLLTCLINDKSSRVLIASFQAWFKRPKAKSFQIHIIASRDKRSMATCPVSKGEGSMRGGPIKNKPETSEPSTASQLTNSDEDDDETATKVHCDEDPHSFSGTDFMTFLMAPHLNRHPHHGELYKCCSDPPGAHRDSPHYVCTFCIRRAEKHIRIAGHRLLRQERFFPLCEDCALSHFNNGSPEGCECGNKADLVKCFECRNNELEICADLRDAELRSRMGLNSTGEMVMKCLCGNDVSRGGNIFRCAGCTRTVVTRALTWDNLQNVYRRVW